MLGLDEYHPTSMGFKLLVDLCLDAAEHSDASNAVVIDVDDPSRRKLDTMVTTIPELVTHLWHEDIAAKPSEEPVPMCLVDSPLAFEMAHVKAVAGSRQVSTTVTLASKLEAGGNRYQLQYYLVPYTDCNGHAQDLLFYFDVYGTQEFALGPHTAGVHALYHRHAPSEYDPAWMEDECDDSIRQWCQGVVDIISA